MSLMWTGRWTWMRSLVLRSRSEQNRSLEKTVMANAEVTGGKAAETVEASETTEEAATVVDSDGTTEGRAVETIEGAATAEVVNPASPSATTIGRVEAATTSISHSEPNATGVEHPAGAGEVEEAARAVIETGHNVETTAGAPSHHETDAIIETPEAVDALETTKVGTEDDRRGTETIGNGEATVSERDVVTTDEVVDRSSEERPKETSVAQRENDRGTHTTAPRGISGPPVGLSEKTSEWT
ncbi:MAG: hypothetical protein VXX90_01105 [Candidatus Thermoplasmatota archaeon]|nr:hypothetical protein [Candidatus Thermoplasmatota archaeon]